jgi:hypothetical protein
MYARIRTAKGFRGVTASWFRRAAVPPSEAYSSEDLAMLARVLDESRKTAVELRGGGLSDEELQELSARLGQVIMERFEAGERDPEFLKKIPLESVQQD